MKVFIDGKEVKCNSNIEVVYESQVVDPNTQREGDLHIQLSKEGMLVVTYFVNDPYKSMWKDLDDVVAECH